MNTAMWEHPATAAHRATLRGWGASEVPPVEKVLACGDTGVGALAAPRDIDAAVRDAIARGVRAAGEAPACAN
jgi:phosphopantothenoylcysteine decarboxylase